MSNWQLIDTAPKDGTRILLWDDEYREVCAGRWKKSKPSDGGWLACGTEEYIFDAKLTHWMPAPSPPAST